MAISFFLNNNNNNPELYHSLARYLKYCIKEDVSFIIPDISNQSYNFRILLTVNDPKNLENCCHWIYINKLNPDKLRVMGFENKSDINLLKFDNLQSQFENSFKIGQGINKIKIPFFRDQINLFFKGHGEQSLLKCLSDTNYYLSNYKNLPMIGDFAPNELFKNFLLPGVDSWNQFKQRFQKYAPVLWVTGWIAETERIERLIIIISNELLKINGSESFFIFELKILQMISEIITILEELAKQTD